MVVLQDTIDVPGATTSGLMRPSSHGPRDDDELISEMFPPFLDEYELPTHRVFLAMPGAQAVEAPLPKFRREEA